MGEKVRQSGGLPFPRLAKTPPSDQQMPNPAMKLHARRQSSLPPRRGPSAIRARLASRAATSKRTQQHCIPRSWITWKRTLEEGTTSCNLYMLLTQALWQRIQCISYTTSCSEKDSAGACGRQMMTKSVSKHVSACDRLVRAVYHSPLTIARAARLGV